MKIVKLSQTEDREAWLQLRRGKITGAKAKSVKMLTRGKDRLPQGFWQLLAEKIAVGADGEDDMKRAHRLENEALEITASKFNLNLNLDPGMWVSDDNEDLAVSPDAAEDTEEPTYAAEAKCLSSANHLKFVIKDQKAQKEALYRSMDSIPDTTRAAYREQVIQYFVINEHLQTLYFTFYDDRIVLDKYMHHVVVINREDILNEIEAQKTMQLETLAEIEKLIKELSA